MKHFILATLSGAFFLFAATFGFAAETLPFEILKTADGHVREIRLVTNKKAGSEAERFLATLRTRLPHRTEELQNMDLTGLANLKPEEQEAFWKAIDYLNSKSVSSLNDDEQINKEFLKAVDQIEKEKFFTLLAAPLVPNAFDREALLREAINDAIDLAQELFLSNPAFSVFEFFVEEYLEALVSRREFYQNALLVWMDTGDTSFSDADKAAIKSSIFYSRLSLTSFSSRKKAIREWATFGLAAQDKWMKKCGVDASSVFHACFRLDQNKILNLVDKNNLLSSKASLAFDYENPSSLASTRWILTVVRLGLKMVPIPGFIKTPVKKWLNSFYREQRRTEGLLYMAAQREGQFNLSTWIRQNTANPLMAP